MTSQPKPKSQRFTLGPKGAILVASFLGLLAIAIHLNKMAKARVSERSLRDFSREAVSKIFHRRAAIRASPVSENSEIDVCLQMIGGSIPGDAKPYLVRAVKSAQLIEKTKREFVANSHGYQQLQALQRKLFIDDYTYAA